jgi:hypothetical protein
MNMNSAEAAVALAQAERNKALLEWQEAAKTLEAAKVDEMDKRLKAFGLCFLNPKEGTNTLTLGNGYELKAEYKFNYNLDKEKVDEALDKIEKTGNEGAFIAERLVTWSPNLSITEYRKLDKQYADLINPALTIKPGTPSLKIVPPKGK